MTTFHFKPDLIHLLTWFSDSPDTGDPACICSYCKEVIEDEGELPLRLWGENSNLELRLHMHCARIVVVELSVPVVMKKVPAKSESRYKYEPAFAEGQAAFTEGERRGSNPYSSSGPQRACYAWWDGWDAAWEEAHPQGNGTDGKES